MVTNDRDCICINIRIKRKMIEHVPKEALKECLRSKRVAKQEVNPQRVVFKCKKVKAEIEVYQGRKRSIKIIE